MNKDLKKKNQLLKDFKYTIEGIPGLSPIDYFNRVYITLEEFFTNHRNIKFNMSLVCLMEQQILKDNQVIGLNEFKAYFNSGSHINIESKDVKKLI